MRTENKLSDSHPRDVTVRTQVGTSALDKGTGNASVPFITVKAEMETAYKCISHLEYYS